MHYRFEEYSQRYQCIRMQRRDGIVEMAMHSDGGPLLWNDGIHEELLDAFHQIARDMENRVVILTGTGDAFCPGVQPGAFAFDPAVPPVALDEVYRSGKAMLMNQLAVPVPMIAAVNGPAHAHCELALLCDIVIASDTASFRDRHLEWGIVPGDGIHIAFPMAFGMNRGRYLALTGAEVTAEQALAWGAVSEVMPLPRLRTRAWELAEYLAARPILGLRYSRELLNREVQRLFSDHLGFGLALEGFSSGYGVWGATNPKDRR